MDCEVDQMKIKQLLTATVVNLCSNYLSYSGELTIQGLIGITIDGKDVLLVNINKTLGHAGSSSTGQPCQTVVQAQAEQSGSVQPVTTGIQQNYAAHNSMVTVQQKPAADIVKSMPASKKRVS